MSRLNPGVMQLSGGGGLNREKPKALSYEELTFEFQRF